MFDLQVRYFCNMQLYGRHEECGKWIRLCCNYLVTHQMNISGLFRFTDCTAKQPLACGFTSLTVKGGDMMTRSVTPAASVTPCSSCVWTPSMGKYIKLLLTCLIIEDISHLTSCRDNSCVFSILLYSLEMRNDLC